MRMRNHLDDETFSYLERAIVTPRVNPCLAKFHHVELKSEIALRQIAILCPVLDLSRLLSFIKISLCHAHH